MKPSAAAFISLGFNSKFATAQQLCCQENTTFLALKPT